MNYIRSTDTHFPEKLLQIPQPASILYYKGNVNTLTTRYSVAIVGSRAVTPYGIEVTSKLAFQLASRGACIISGLALGVDAIAHKAALEAKGQTIAVLPSPVSAIYPASNRGLAAEIIDKNGLLVSEYGSDDRSAAFKSRFIERNRIVSGLADVVLVTEAGERSGTLHTANFALDQGKTVMAVPGNITSTQSKGTNSLIRAGATPVTSAEDIIHELGIDDNPVQLEIHADNQQERCVLDLLKKGISDTSELQIKSTLSPSEFNQTITMLEINGKIKPLGGGKWALSAQ